jgi:2-oxoglutarate dehydrogenase E2 component (dihydrolipoamide succinyltransferase)
MTVELKIPAVGESIQEVQIGRWLKQKGQRVNQDENLVEIETDKASVDLPAPAAGVITKILKQNGEAATVGEVIGYLDEGGESSGDGSETATKQREAKTPEEKGEPTETPKRTDENQKRPTEPAKPREAEKRGDEASRHVRVMPGALRALSKYNLRAEQVPATGPGNRLLEEDVLRYVKEHASQSRAEEPTEAPAAEQRIPDQPSAERRAAKQPSPEPRAAKERAPEQRAPEPRAARPAPKQAAAEVSREPEAKEAALEEIVPMSLIRRRIAQRLVEAQQTAALLTTFNEVDMAAVMEMRQKHRDAFQAKYGVKLGFMSFFVKAVIDALKQFPEINAEIRDNNIVYRNYFNIGIAIGGGKGLVVPVLRNADRMSFAEVEQAIGELGKRAREKKITPDQLLGGTFTITNGGIYGSLLSTPIVNPPQSGILGMHTIQERPVARNGQVVIRPMMYVALTYDHRIVDGEQAVTFLRRIKEAVEEPSRMLIEI